MDKLQSMKAYVRVVETGSFSSTAAEFNTTQATISKRVSALEGDLGAQLLIRGSREHKLTEAGRSYYERASFILNELDEAESEALGGVKSPKGFLRVSAPLMMGSLFLSPLVPRFLDLYPDISLELLLSERKVDLVADGVDVAIRIGQLSDSSMIARLLGQDELIIVASPQYLSKHSEPNELKDLEGHNCMIYSLSPDLNRWSFSEPVPGVSQQVQGNFQCDNATGLLDMLLADAGIALMPRWFVMPYIETGELVHLLPAYKKKMPIHAVYVQNRFVSTKLKCFLDFLTGAMKKEAHL